MRYSKNDLVGLIPAAGMGSRLGLPFPKELIPLPTKTSYKPVAQSILEQIVFAGVEHIVMVINDQKHQLIKYFGDGHRFGCKISYVVQEQDNDHRRGSVTPGLAEAMNAGYHLVKDKIVVFGMPDTIISPMDTFKIALESSNDQYDLVFCLFKALRPEKSGMVRLGEPDEVVEIVDKPKETSLAWMWGTIIWKPRFNEFLNDRITNKKIYDYGIILNDALKAGLKFGGVKFENGSYLDVGTFDDISVLGRM